MNLEDFKQVEGFPDYLISEYGVVWDTRQNKELKWIKNNDFNCVNMYNTGGKKEWKQICDENPNSPEIHPTLISILDNFSTEEYLKTKNI